MSTMNNATATVSAELIGKIKTKQARIGVIGLGYVGLPLVVEFAAKGFPSVGFEVDQSKADKIGRGESYIPDVPTAQVNELVAQGNLTATTDFGGLSDCDVIIICVPTPLRKTKEPDISFILAATDEIKKSLKRGQLIILESTTYPGTTDEILKPAFEEMGFKIDEDFLLAFSPERVDPGNPQFKTHNIPKVVGGCTEDSTEAAATLYGAIVDNVHPVTSARVAEAAKLLENTFRAVNIGMANEMARLCYALNIDTWEVIRAAATKPFGFMAFYPGPGIGGHCLAGKETVVVRDGKGERVENLAELFQKESAKNRVRRFIAHGSDVIYKPDLQTLSVDVKTNERSWKSIEYLFRRKTDASIVTITTSDNRRVTVTDLHPMLVADEHGDLRQVPAKDIQAGDRLPIHVAGDAETNFADPRIDLLSFLPRESYGIKDWLGEKGAKLQSYFDNSRFDNSRRIVPSRTFKKLGDLITVPVKSIEIALTKNPIEVFSVEVESNHTFATSYGIFVHNCIPLDPHYLSWKARQHGFDSRFIGLAEEVNSRMPDHVVTLVTDSLNDDRKALNGSRVLVLGVAYKKDIDDVRESPALSIIDRLRAKGVEVVYHDPFIPKINFDDAHTESTGEPLQSIELTSDEIKRADCILIVTDHSGVDYASVVAEGKLVVDTRNCLDGEQRRNAQARIIRL